MGRFVARYHIVITWNGGGGGEGTLVIIVIVITRYDETNKTRKKTDKEFERRAVLHIYIYI